MIDKNQNQIKESNISLQILQISEEQHLLPEMVVDDQSSKNDQVRINKQRHNIQRRFGQTLFQNNIHIISNTKDYANDLKIDFIQISKDWKMIKLSIKYKQYCFNNIDMVINDFISPLHCLKQKTYGTYGSVYPAIVNQNKIAIKCIELQYQSNFIDEFQNILKEFLFTKLASAIRVGPKVMEKQLGFSIFVYHDCMEFAMEFCEQINLYSKQAQIDLNECLETLHDFKIIHYDIKLGNICYSPAYKKHIFIDYGLSDVAKTERHQKQLVYYRGTFAYCSNQMKKLYSLKNKRQLINLYKNDKHGLNQTIKQLKLMLPLRQREPQLLYFLSSYYQYYLIISHLFNNDKKREMEAFFKQFFKDKETVKLLSEQIIRTINSLRYSYNIQRIFNKQIQQFSQLIHLIKESNLSLAKRKRKIICKESLGDNSTEIQYKFRIILFKYLPTLFQINQPIYRLKSQELVKQMEAQHYLHQVAKYIRVEQKHCSYEEKLIIQNVFLKFYARINVQGQHQINLTILLYFFNYCFDGQITSLKIKIAQELISSFLLFELISQNDYLQFFSNVLSKCKNIDTLLQSRLLIIRFLSAVQWLRIKIAINKHNYWRLKNQLWAIFCQFVSQLYVQNPLKDILFVIKILKQINSLNQIVTDISINIYYINQPQKPINLSCLKVTLPKKFLESINIQNLSAEQIIAYGLKFDIQIIEEYYQNICSKIKFQQKSLQFQLQTKELIFFLIDQNTRSRKSAQAFKKLNQFQLQSKDNKIAKYYFYELINFAKENYQLDYQNFILELHLQTFEYYKFYDTLRYFAKQKLFYKEIVYPQQQYNKNIQMIVFEHLSSNNFQDFYTISLYAYLAQQSVANRTSKQFKQTLLNILIQKQSTFYEIINRQMLAITQYNNQKIQIQYSINQNLIYLHNIIFYILQQYPQKIQYLVQYVNISFKLHANLQLSAKFYLLSYLYRFRQSLLIRNNEQQLLFQQFFKFGLFLLKISNYRLIMASMTNQIYYLLNQQVKEYVNRLIIYCIQNNQKLILQIFYSIGISQLINKFTSIFVTLCHYHCFQQMINIIKILIQQAEYNNDRIFMVGIILNFTWIHGIIGQKYSQCHSYQQYHRTALSLLSWNNPYLSFYLIALLTEWFSSSQKDKKIYLFICKSLDKLNRESKNILLQHFLYTFCFREFIIAKRFNQINLRTFIKNKRHKRKICLRMLKMPQQQINYSQKINTFKEALRPIIQPKVRFRFKPFYDLFFIKLQKYYQIIDYKIIIDLFKQKKNKYLKKDNQ